MRRTVLTITVLSLFISATAHTGSRHWRGMTNQKLFTFDWNCSRTDSFPSKALNKVVHRAISSEDRGSPTTYGDRAFKTALRKHGPTVYFVPTVCGAVGNCTWRLYTINPVRYLGEINGQYIYTYQSSQGMPNIITYGHMSASEGVLETYGFRNGRYAALADHYPIGPEDRTLEIQSVQGRKMPKFLNRARSECKNIGL